MNNILKRVIEFFAFTYFNWLIVVPSLIPFMIFWVGVTGEQLTNWLIMSVFTSLYIGWITVKADSKFAPWFYKKIGIDKRTKEQKIVDITQKTHDRLVELRHGQNMCSYSCSYCTELRLLKRLLDRTQRLN